MVDVLYAAGANIVFPTDAPAGLVWDASAAALVNDTQAKCVAHTAASVPPAAPLVVMRIEMWATYHAKVLRLVDQVSTLPVSSARTVAREADRVLCALAGVYYKSHSACVEVHSPRVHIFDRRISEAEAGFDASARTRWFGAKSTGISKGPNALGSLWTNAVVQAGAKNEAEAATPLCWVHGMPKDGLSLNRASRTRVNQENAVRKAEAKASWDRMVAGRQARAFANARSNAGA